MCPSCEGIGEVSDIDLSQLYDDSKALNECVLITPDYTANGQGLRIFTESGFLDPDKPIHDYTKEEPGD